MFIFNTTFVVPNSEYVVWRDWLYNSYMSLMNNYVTSSLLGVYEVVNTDVGEEKTISVQWKVATPNELEVINKQSPIILAQMNSKFGQGVLFFSSILKAL